MKQRIIAIIMVTTFYYFLAGNLYSDKPEELDQTEQDILKILQEKKMEAAEELNKLPFKKERITNALLKIVQHPEMPEQILKSAIFAGGLIDWKKLSSLVWGAHAKQPKSWQAIEEGLFNLTKENKPLPSCIAIRLLSQPTFVDLLKTSAKREIISLATQKIKYLSTISDEQCLTHKDEIITEKAKNISATSLLMNLCAESILLICKYGADVELTEIAAREAKNMFESEEAEERHQGIFILVPMRNAPALPGDFENLVKAEDLLDAFQKTRNPVIKRLCVMRLSDLKFKPAIDIFKNYQRKDSNNEYQIWDKERGWIYPIREDVEAALIKFKVMELPDPVKEMELPDPVKGKATGYYLWLIVPLGVAVGLIILLFLKKKSVKKT